MQETSQLYKDLLADPNHTMETKLVISGVTYDQSKIYSVNTITKAFDNAPTIGGVYAATLDFRILLDN